MNARLNTAVTVNSGGSPSETIPGPAPVTLPTLTNWKFAPEAPEAQPGFDDSSPSTPVLYASDYGYDHGFVWYRGHFVGQQSSATGTETGVTLTADGISPTGATRSG